jgi:hypothetical protein
MREFTKAVLNFSWAMSLFSLEELANLLIQNPSTSEDKLMLAFDAVTQATVQQFGIQNVIQGVFQAGNELQRAMLDLLFGFLTLEALHPNSMLRIPADMMTWSTETFGCLISGGDSLLAWSELQNKMEVFILVPNIPSRLHLPAEQPYPPLPEVVERAYALEPYPTLWAVEGLGDWYGNTFWQRNEIPHSILTDERVSDLPAKSLLMLHAGIGLSFAKHYLQTVNHLSSISEICQVLTEIIRLCRENSRPGYEGAALESLGLVTRSATFTGDSRPEMMVQIVSKQLVEIDPDVLGYFWHGVGRAIYFLPINFLPCYGSIWHAVAMIQREVPDESVWYSALAGLAWGVTMVNIRQPAILANLLRHYGEQLSANDVFSYGVASSIMMRYDTTPDDPHIMQFCQYQPELTEPSLIRLWDSQVRQPVQEALQAYYPILKQHGRLGEIFCYQALPALTD